MRRITSFFAVLTAFLALAACGGGGSGSGAETAKIVPPSAYFYGEAVIDPSGGQEKAVRSIIAKFPGEGPPEQRIEKLLVDGLKTRDTGSVDYVKDIKPWLGETAAAFAIPGPATSKKVAGGVIIATKDEDAARKAIQKAGGSNLTKATYKGVDYWRDAPGDGDLNAGGVIDGFAVLADEAGFKAAIDASKGDSLVDSDRFKKAVEDAPEERIGLLYADIQGAIGAAAQQSGAGAQVALLSGAFKQLFGDQPIVATAKAENDGVVIDSTLPASGGTIFSIFGKGTDLVGELPAGSWVAFGQPELGKYISQLIDLAAGLAGGREAIAAQVRQASGLDLDRDILGWIGDVAFFVAGTSKADLGGGAVIKTTDPAASKRAIAGLERLISAGSSSTKLGPAGIPGAEAGFSASDTTTPQPVYVVQKGDRVVIAYGEKAATDALAGGAPLGDDAAFKNATGKLGGDYKASMYVAIAPIIEVARSFGASEAELSKAEPYLAVFDHLVGGTKTEGDKLKSRFRIGLQ
jgi:hypothetical protein